MNPFLDFIAKNYQRFLGPATSDMCKVLEALLIQKRSNPNFKIIIVGNKNLVPAEQGFLSIAKIFDTLINIKGFDGHLIVVDAEGVYTDQLSAMTSDKTSIVNDDYMTILSGMASTLEQPIDLLFFTEGGNTVVSNTYSKNMKPVTIIDDILDEGSLLVLDQEQRNSSLAASLESWADEDGKKLFVSQHFAGWIW